MKDKPSFLRQFVENKNTKLVPDSIKKIAKELEEINKANESNNTQTTGFVYKVIQRS